MAIASPKWSDRGFVRATQIAVPVSEFRLSDGRSLSIAMPQLDPNRDDPKKCEHAVGVDWKAAVPITEAKWFKGAFANQNVVCKLRHQPTVEYLKREFAID